jgi:uncharacterized protein YdaU (DUF1376 family)
MAKDPAFLFYPGDWLGGTMGMTFEEKGAYFELLIFQFNCGAFTEAQAKQVLGICSASVFTKVLQKFSKTGNLYFNKRLADEIEKRRSFSESRRNNAKSKKSTKPKEKKSEAYAQHMEDENRNENENVNEDFIKKSKLEIFEELFSDEVFIEGLAMTHKGKDLKQAFEECYIHHSNAPNPPQALWQWKQKFNTWLTIKKTEKKNGKGFTDKRTEHIEGLIDDFNKRP